MGKEILMALLVLALIIGGGVIAAYIMGWLIDRKLMGYTIAGIAVLWLIRDPSSALAFIGIAIGIILLFLGGGQSGGPDRGGYDNDG